MQPAILALLLAVLLALTIAWTVIAGDKKQTANKLVILVLIFAVTITWIMISRKRVKKQRTFSLVKPPPNPKEEELLSEFPRSGYDSNSTQFLNSEKNRPLLVSASDLEALVSQPHRPLLVLYFPKGSFDDIVGAFSRIPPKNITAKSTIIPLLIVSDPFNGNKDPCVVLWNCKTAEKFTGELTTENLIDFVHCRCFGLCGYTEVYDD